MNRAILTNKDRYTMFTYKGITITFLHGKDLVRYKVVKEYSEGCLTVICEGKIKKEFEDYIDLKYLVDNLYMDAETYLSDLEGVDIAYV